jgi:hypothetical protein
VLFRSGAEKAILRLYDTPLALSPDQSMRMPRIVRGACR